MKIYYQQYQEPYDEGDSVQLYDYGEKYELIFVNSHDEVSVTVSLKEAEILYKKLEKVLDK